MIAQRTSAAMSAGIKPLTLKPLTIVDTPKIKNAFMTKVKSPSVSRFIGSVNIRRTGFIITFAIPSTKATIRAVAKLATWNPGTMLATIKIESAESIQLTRRPMRSEYTDK